jgi:DNA-directed RNA polymerase subunit RPC12/RpoP
MVKRAAAKFVETETECVRCPHCRFVHLEKGPLSQGGKLTEKIGQSIAIYRPVRCRKCGKPFTHCDARRPPSEKFNPESGMDSFGR